MAQPFSVTVRSQWGRFTRTEPVHAGHKAEFLVPEGEYMLCVQAPKGIDPGGQCTWLQLRPGQHKYHCALFSGERKIPTKTVTFTLRDAHYPNIIPLNGGITVWQKKP